MRQNQNLEINLQNANDDFKNQSKKYDGLKDEISIMKKENQRL